MADRDVLFLEDDLLLARAWGRELAALGWSLHHADTVEGARALAGTRTFVAWIVDVQLPDGSGIELLAWARGQGSRVPVLVVTGGAEPRVINDIVLWGGEFAFKPCTTAHLVRFLERAADGARTSVPDLARDYSRTNGLSKRETELVVARASGIARGDLARVLGVKPNTIKSMVRHIRKKTRVANMEDLILQLLRSHSSRPRTVQPERIRSDSGASPARPASSSPPERRGR